MSLEENVNENVKPEISAEKKEENGNGENREEGAKPARRPQYRRPRRGQRAPKAVKMRHKTMMIERIRPWVQGKKVLILGFGREGKSTWNVLKKLDCCSFVDVADMAEPKEKPEGIRNWIAGPDYQKCLNE